MSKIPQGGFATESVSEAPAGISPQERAVCWTIIHHLTNTEEKSKITPEELLKLSRHIGNSVMPEDMTLVTETIEGHYPGLIQKVDSSIRWDFGNVRSLFNQYEKTGE